MVRLLFHSALPGHKHRKSIQLPPPQFSDVKTNAYPFKGYATEKALVQKITELAKNPQIKTAVDLTASVCESIAICSLNRDGNEYIIDFKPSKGPKVAISL